jgi:triacylglycerol lipase
MGPASLFPSILKIKGEKSMKKLLVFWVCFIILLGTAGLSGAALFDTSCKTKYPIVLVHGAFFRDKNMLGINYWWGIDKALKDKGAKIYVSNQDPFNGVNPRTEQLANELAYQYKLFLGPLYRFSKINIIAHSMGPLDSRNLIANYAIPGVCAAGSCHTKVATLTSISGTHKGSEVADVLYWAYNNIPILGPVVGDALTNLIDVFGETFEMAGPQNTKLLLENLTSDFIVNTFNPNTPNRTGVRYEAYGGKINYINTAVDPLGQSIVAILYTVMNLMGAGDNDGLVSLDSAHIPNLCKAGESCYAPVWKGEMTTSLLYPGVNHFYEINHFLGNTPGWDAKGFYVNVAKDLKARGF